MKKQAVQEICDNNVRPMAAALGLLPGWSIEYQVLHSKDKPPSVRGTPPAASMGNDRYRWCRIVVFYDQNSTRNEVLECIRHELLHAITFLSTTFFNAAAAKRSKKVRGILDEIWLTMAEHQVLHMERMLDRCKLTPAALVKKGEKILVQ